MSHCYNFFVIDLHSCFVSVYMRPLLHGVITLLILILITSGSAGNLNEGEGP